MIKQHGEYAPWRGKKMDPRLVLKRTNEKLDKMLFSTAAFIAAALAISAGILSYKALMDLAIESGIDPSLAFLFPITIDGMILSGSTLILFYASRAQWSIQGMILTLLGVAGSVAGNVIMSEDVLRSQIVHGVPPVVLFLTLEVLTNLMRQRIRDTILRDELDAEEAAALDNSKLQSASPTRPAAPAATVKRSSPVVEKPQSARASDGPKKNPAVDAQEEASKTVLELEKSSPTSANENTGYDWGDMSIRDQARKLLDDHGTEDIGKLAAMTNSKDTKYARRIIRAEMEKREAVSA